LELSTSRLQEHFGLEILDVDLARVDDATCDGIRRIWQKDPLLLLRRQSLTEDELLSFSRCFGKLDVNVGGLAPAENNPEILCISNLMRQDGSALGGLGSDELVWHTDQIYRQQPASGSIFLGVEMPPNAGFTSFCNMALAYDALPDALRDRVDGRRSLCRYGARNPLGSLMRLHTENTFWRKLKSEEQAREVEESTPEVTHDMVLENPATGQRSLYLSPNHTIAIEGLPEAEGRELFDALLDHALRDEFIYTHHWRNGDVVMWDNARLLHRRDAFDGSLARLAKRTTIYMDSEYFAAP
jgi:taurine dioxygenase